MTPTKSRFTHLLVSITIALMLSPTVGALPRQERTRNQSIPPRALVKLPPDLSTRSTLFCCGERGSGASRAGFIRWTEATRMSEDSREVRLKEQLPLEKYESLPKYYDWGEHLHHPSPTTTPDSPSTAPDISNRVRMSLYKRDHHHHHHSVDHSRGHSEHWFKHHGLEIESNDHIYDHSHHHNRHRGKAPGPSRLGARSQLGRDSEFADTFIAPLSVRLQYVPRFKGHDRSGDRRETRYNRKWDNGGVRRSSVNSSSRPKSPYDDKSVEIEGIIDLMHRSPNGEKIGGLSISSLPPNDTIANATSLSFVIDSTPNLIEQSTFFLHRFSDQSSLDHEFPTTEAVRDLLVALEVPYTPNITDSAPSNTQRMCATFNPLELNVQTFGLALCMNQDDAINDRRMSQAFRYSVETGVLQPYYGAGAPRDSVLAAVNERIAELEAVDPPNTSQNNARAYNLDFNITALSPTSSLTTTNPGPDCDSDLESMDILKLNTLAIDLNLTAPMVSSSPALDPMSASYPSTTNTIPIATSVSALTSHMSRPTLIIGTPPDSISAASADMGVVMVFRLTLDAETWRRTRDDVDTPDERQRTLKQHQGVGIVRQDATELGHWAAMDMFKASKIDLTAAKSEDKRKLENNDPPIRRRTVPEVFSSTPYPDNSGTRSSSAPQYNSGGSHSGVLDDDVHIRNPMVNAAYVGDSGRSAPVPPEDQADNLRPILVADPIAKPHPPQLAVANPVEPTSTPKEDVIGVFLVSPSYHAKESPAPGVMVAVPSHKTGPLGIPIDASD